MANIEPTLLWTIGLNLISIAFGAGYVRYQVLTNSKDNERLRQDLRDHMKEEKEQMDKLLGRMDKTLDRISDQGERLAKGGL